LSISFSDGSGPNFFNPGQVGPVICRSAKFHLKIPNFTIFWPSLNQKKSHRGRIKKYAGQSWVSPLFYFVSEVCLGRFGSRSISTIFFWLNKSYLWLWCLSLLLMKLQDAPSQTQNIWLWSEKISKCNLFLQHEIIFTSACLDFENLFDIITRSRFECHTFFSITKFLWIFPR